MCLHAMVHMWRSKDNFVEFVLSFKLFSFATNTQCSAQFVKKIILAPWILEIKLRSPGTSIAPVYFLEVGSHYAALT